MQIIEASQKFFEYYQLADVNKMEDEKEKARQYSKTVAPFLDKIRYHIDKLELIVDDEIWPLPKYRELLFTS